jgi:hypothetical protein
MMSAVGTAQTDGEASRCRPSGTLVESRIRFPALKRWANLCCACGAQKFREALQGEIMGATQSVKPVTDAELDQLCINTIRTLSIDAV